jgi:hypothetical protein
MVGELELGVGCNDGQLLEVLGYSSLVGHTVSSKENVHLGSDPLFVVDLFGVFQHTRAVLVNVNIQYTG